MSLMIPLFAWFLLKICPTYGQVLDDSVVCSLGVTWGGGSVELHELVSDSVTAIGSAGVTLNSLTRDETSGVFYLGGNSILFEYDPCNGGGITQLGAITGLIGGSIRALAYCTNDDTLYAFDDASITDYLYSIDLTTLAATLRGSTGLPTIQGAECDANGDLYAWSRTHGLILMNKNDGSFSTISATSPDQNFQYLTYDPNNNDIIYGSNQGTIYEISKATGALTATSLNDNAYRGLILLDQDSCTSVTDCPSYFIFSFFFVKRLVIFN